jgi:hypothetical protein
MFVCVCTFLKELVSLAHMDMSSAVIDDQLLYVGIYIYTHTHTHMHVDFSRSWHNNVCMHMCKHVPFTAIQMTARACMHIRMYIYMYVPSSRSWHMYVCMHVCKHVPCAAIQMAARALSQSQQRHIESLAVPLNSQNARRALLTQEQGRKIF